VINENNMQDLKDVLIGVDSYNTSDLLRNLVKEKK
jgi:hypothetical protein